VKKIDFVFVAKQTIGWGLLLSALGLMIQALAQWPPEIANQIKTAIGVYVVFVLIMAVLRVCLD